MPGPPSLAPPIPPTTTPIRRVMYPMPVALTVEPAPMFAASIVEKMSPGPSASPATKEIRRDVHALPIQRPECHQAEQARPRMTTWKFVRAQGSERESIAWRLPASRSRSMPAALFRLKARSHTLNPEGSVRPVPVTGAKALYSALPRSRAAGYPGMPGLPGARRTIASARASAARPPMRPTSAAPDVARGCEREDRVAISRCVGRRNGARRLSCAIWCDFGGLGSSSMAAFCRQRPRVSWLPPDSQLLQRTRSEQCPRVSETLPVLGANTRNDFACRGVDHVADRIHRDQRGDDQTIGHGDRSGAKTAFHRAIGTGGASRSLRPPRHLHCPRTPGPAPASWAARYPQSAVGRISGLPPTPSQ